MLEDKNILVTGGAGFMGSDFIRMVLASKAFSGKITNLDLLTYAGNLENLKEVEKDPRYSFVKGDVCDQKLIEDLFEEKNFDLVVHFAAETHVDRSIDQPRTFIDTNVFGIYTLLESLRRHKESYLHVISTDEVYGDLPKEGGFTEESRYIPSSPYAASKAAADHFALAYARTYGVKVTISHASNNYGPRQYPEKLIPRMIQCCMHGENLHVYGSGQQVRDWLFVRDHSEAIWAILEKGRKGEVYNVGGKQKFTNLEVIYSIIQQFSMMKGVDPDLFYQRIVHVADRPGHDFCYVMDITKIQNEIGWMPKVSFIEGLTKTIEEMLVLDGIYTASFS